jgi:hypothetical protein
MTAGTNLIAGDDLKAAALDYLSATRTRVEREQSGLHSIFDSWFTRVLTRLIAFDPNRSWEDCVAENAVRAARAGARPKSAMGLDAVAAIPRSLAARPLCRIFPA